MKKKTPEIKTKEFQLSELELLKIENIQLRIREANQLFAQQTEMVLAEVCKRVGQKKENLIIAPDGQIFLEKGKVKFKE